MSVTIFVLFFLDPRVKQWSLMSSPIPTLAIIGIYLLAVLKVLPLYMSFRKPFKLTSVIRYYNIIQIVSCIFILYKVSIITLRKNLSNIGN